MHTVLTVSAILLALVGGFTWGYRSGWRGACRMMRKRLKYDSSRKPPIAIGEPHEFAILTAEAISMVEDEVP